MPDTPDLSAILGPRHTVDCESCARPATEAGRRILAQFHGWPDKAEYPWNMLDADDVIEIENEARRIDALTAAVESLPGRWTPSRSYPGDHHGIDYIDRSAVLAILRGEQRGRWVPATAKGTAINVDEWDRPLHIWQADNA